MTPTCPPAHVPYLSPMLAGNALTLHHLAHPHCPGIDSWACGDHWHIGHPTAAAGDECKAGDAPREPRPGVRRQGDV
jgi:hypothetical protein